LIYSGADGSLSSQQPTNSSTSNFLLVAHQFCEFHYCSFYRVNVAYSVSSVLSELRV
jgi:hypothetical protein